ncbi:hypothetical protein PAXINDRAFT_16811 [Paxillus involutus ATCC 200175]|uniref:Uncharacterized protein n=1 Tax=Paxillus involutus ATCC 200175 TaxID=664439 RepID=A0A0C9TSN2_PAXIN|nr:hypothetical protein PAXINDRAFT_16811 [Paxillus involutus ATCC 200175]
MPQQSLMKTSRALMQWHALKTPLSPDGRHPQCPGGEQGRSYTLMLPKYHSPKHPTYVLCAQTLPECPHHGQDDPPKPSVSPDPKAPPPWPNWPTRAAVDSTALNAARTAHSHPQHDPNAPNACLYSTQSHTA